MSILFLSYFNLSLMGNIHLPKELHKF